jgi:hypothetical protein
LYSYLYIYVYIYIYIIYIYIYAYVRMYIEFGGAEACKYVPQALATFSRGAQSEDNVLRQSSVYGIAQASRKFPSMFISHLETLVPLLVSIASSPSAQEEENEGTTENGIFALGTILTTPAYRVNSWGGFVPAVIAPLWLKGLPLRTDEQVAKLAHAQLCDIVERGDPVVLGDGYSNIPELMRIFSEVLMVSRRNDGGEIGVEEGGLAHPITVRRIESLVKQLSSGMGAEQLKVMCADLSHEQQIALALQHTA